MERTYWHRQHVGKPLFPDLEWSRPETRAAAGKLLIIGGNLHGFAAPAEAYQIATKAGAGTIRAILPDRIQKTVGAFLENAFFAASTPSGSFGQAGLAELMEHAAWADGVLFAGDLGRNSETAVLLETFLTKYQGRAVLTKDAVDYFYSHPQTILDREQTTIIASLSQLQQLTTKAKYPQPLRYQMDLLQIIEWLHEFTLQHPCAIVVKHLDNLIAAQAGEVSTTPCTDEIWRLQTAAKASVWLMQHPSKQFEAITTALTINHL